MPRIIEVLVSPQGETSARGFAGGACLHASRFLEQALGDCRAENSGVLPDEG